MKASEMISVLAQYIERFGDKKVLVNTGDGTFREFCAMDSPGLFNYVGKPPKNGKDKPYIYFDVDFV